MKAKLRLLLSLSLFFLCFSIFPQDGINAWREAGPEKGPDIRKVAKGSGYELEVQRLGQALQPVRRGQSPILYFPDATGGMVAYRVEERPVMAPDLQQRYPNIRSYVGYGLGPNAGKRIRFSWSHKGLQATLHDPADPLTHFIEQVPRNPGTYVLYSRDQKDAQATAWKCGTPDTRSKTLPGDPTAKLVDDQVLRRYRLAVAATGEYTEYHGGTVADALAAINATVTRINEVFERDLAVQFELVAVTDQVIYTDPATDPFGGNFNSEVQNTLDTVLGSGAYDIGHLFHQGGEAGNAGAIGTVCDDGLKGSAYAATPIPEGDRFDLDFVAHEMGHQLGANHTWSFDTEGTGVQAEPASGTTIMGYAGIAQGNNVANQGDDYFHYYSILQMTNFAASLSCGDPITLSNTPPVIQDQPDYTIPAGTAFALQASAADPDPTDVLTYAWEQIDDGVVTTASFGPANPVGANFRSLPPVGDSIRYFPRLSRILSGDLTQSDPATGTAWETVSEIERGLNFALTVRDNGPGGGQVASDQVGVRVLSAAGPFRLTSQAAGETYPVGSVQTVLWDVAGTDSGPVNCQFVDLYFSSDGGASFPILLARDLPNTGAAEVQMPAIPTTQGRLMLKASNNVFLAVNGAAITLTPQDFVLQASELMAASCQPDDAVFTTTYRSFGGFNEEVTLGVDGVPAGLSATFSSPTVQLSDTNVDLTFSNTAGAAPGIYLLTLTGTAGAVTFELPFVLELGGGVPAPPVLTAPSDASMEAGLQPELQWEASPGAIAYYLELATDAAFANILEQQELVSNAYVPSVLEPASEYFWRVRAQNACGNGNFSAAFSFRTVTSDCRATQASGLPLTISATGTPTVTTSIQVTEDLPVVLARVGLDIDHSFLSDLIIRLQSPEGTVVTLISNSCGEANDLVAVFDPDAPAFVCGNNPAINGTVRPLGSLTAFAGESSQGEWILTIEDTLPADGGSLNAFTLELCVEGEFRPDADGDGVFDDGDDLCLGTEPGAEVDANGCPVYRFAPDQFSIELSTVSCLGNQDGSIRIVAREALSYTAALTGNGVDRQVDFGLQTELSGLAPGQYQLCLSGTDGSNPFQPQCFGLQIDAPQPLSVLSRRAPDGSRLILDLEGAEHYRIRLNGEEQIVASRQVSLDFREGLNKVEVEAIPACRGRFSQEYFYSARPAVAPNPFRDQLDFYLPWISDSFELRMYNAAGVQVYRSRILITENHATLGLPFLPPGLYIVRLTGSGRTATYKLFRE